MIDDRGHDDQQTPPSGHDVPPGEQETVSWESPGSQETAPGERRGETIEGGTAQPLAKGDVLVVPNGVPHQFTEVRGPFLYYVVKVTASSAGSRR